MLEFSNRSREWFSDHRPLPARYRERFCNKKNLVRVDCVLYSEAAQASFSYANQTNRLVDVKPAPQNIQDGFLNLARREKTTVTIYLVNGAKLLGRIKSFDKFSLILESGAQEQLIFKHAISTISQPRRATGELRGPQQPVSENPAEPIEEPAAS
jgi:host factor-I protein